MKEYKYEKNVVDFAHEIIAMEEEINYLRAENKQLKEYEEKYTKLLDESIKHGNTMMGYLLKASLNMDEKQILKAFDKEGEDI